MKTIIFYLSIILSASLLYSQSSIVYDAGTNIDIGTGADVCAATITVNGTYSGNGTFCNAPVDVERENEEDLVIPKEFSLSQNYPNPFNPSTVIKYQLPISSLVILKVYDILGDEVATLANEEKPTGFYEVIFDASRLSSGFYIYKITAGNFVSTKKMILIK
jgi:hypothetical protein